MGQKTSYDRMSDNRDLIDSKTSLKIKELIHPVVVNLSQLKIKYDLIGLNNIDDIDSIKNINKPIIFVSNHSSSFDVPIAFKVIRKHVILLAAKQRLGFEDELFFNLNGTIFVDRKDKEDMNLSKYAMIKNLENKKNILVFPEGTWNMTDSKLMLDMKWGIIDVAKKSNALIVPLALDYDRDNLVCKYKFGEAIDVLNMSNIEGITIVRDSIATLRWDIYESKIMCERNKISLIKEREKLMDFVREYKPLDYEYEKSVVFKTNQTPEEIFEPIKKLSKRR